MRPSRLGSLLIVVSFLVSVGRFLLGFRGIRLTLHSSVAPPDWDLAASLDDQWAQLGRSLEHSLDGRMISQPGTNLQAGHKGWLQRTSPRVRSEVTTMPRPSRPSEVLMRNDLLGGVTKQWFRQLRRLQNFHHAASAGKTTVNALVYRLELWTSIRRAAGFQDGFATWWRYHRVCSLPGVPICLPAGPPSADQAHLIFLSFKACYERFESWHLRQRASLLKHKYEAGMKALYGDLRKPAKGHLDLLTNTIEYGVLATEPETGQLHVDQPIVTGGFSQWFLDEEPVQVTAVNEVVVQIDAACEPGQVLVQRQTISSVSGLQAALLDYWSPAWTAWTSVGPSTWSRVVGFLEAYVPRLSLDLPPITVPQWKRALKRYKPTAARGVDGVSHLDLINLPEAWALRLLDLLRQIEAGLTDWPLSLLYGVVNVLAKDQDACRVDRFRPVVVFSIIYRTWSSLRAAQLLRQVTPYIDAEAFGFLPGHEPSQLWLLLQAQIESSLQDGSVWCGLSTDLVRAFNNIPRQHSFRLAQHLGLPLCVLSPWRSFLQSCTRSFKVRGFLSQAVASTCGMPEGDAVSVYAMVQLGWVWHIYMRHFCPQVRSLSFVDNLSLVAANSFDLAWGWSCLVEFFRLWNLSVYVCKSYCWALSKTLRDQLGIFPMDLVHCSRELGGVLSFTRRQHTGLQHSRFNALGPRWDLLRFSRAPLVQKLISLATVFWTSALRGVHGSGVGSTCLHRLRTTTMKVLRLNKAGVNGLLRLSLSIQPEADPGYWLLDVTLSSFRRLAKKEPRMMTGLRLFVANFDGKLLSGPFSNLLAICNQLGWKLEPPFFLDHDGCLHPLAGSG